MSEIITEDMVEELMYASNRGGTSTHLAAAEALHEWSNLDVTRFGDYVSAASLLVSAGEHFSLGGDNDRAVQQFRLAVEASGDAPPDTRVYLLQGLLDAGLTEEAHEVADTIRRERPVDVDVYVFIAESFELVDDHERAQRWFSMGLRLADDRDVPLSEFDYELLLMGRRRVRQSAGLPEDVLDTNAREALEHRHPGV
jgi:tetratricopeptide (TPR) repeat protein